MGLELMYGFKDDGDAVAMSEITSGIEKLNVKHNTVVDGDETQVIIYNAGDEIGMLRCSFIDNTEKISFITFEIWISENGNELLIGKIDEYLKSIGMIDPMGDSDY